MWKKFNILEECRSLDIPLFQCPPFLTIILGFITVISIVGTYILASGLVDEPEVAALIVILVTVAFLVFGRLIISGFERIAESNRMKSEFIFIITHQLRSPISILKWTLDAMEMRMTKEPQPSQTRPEQDGSLNDSLTTFRNTIDNIALLVNSLMEVSRIEARTLILKNEPFSLTTLSENITDNYQRSVPAARAVLRLEAPASLPDAYGDRSRIFMVIQNLVDNAIRYAGGTISISIEQADGMLRWSVKDRGRGIPATQQKYIFQKFFRSKDAQKNEVHGSGIGLYIAKAIIDNSGGKIGFESQEGKGSTFWFTLPLSKKG